MSLAAFVPTVDAWAQDRREPKDVDRELAATMEQLMVLRLSKHLELTVERGGSDLHLSVGAPPLSRVHGVMQPLEDFNLEKEDCENLILSVLTQTQRSILEDAWELDFALQVEVVGRFREQLDHARVAQFRSAARRRRGSCGDRWRLRA